jgi:hypothetical protein
MLKTYCFTPLGLNFLSCKRETPFLTASNNSSKVGLPETNTGNPVKLELVVKRDYFSVLSCPFYCMDFFFPLGKKSLLAGHGGTCP